MWEKLSSARLAAAALAIGLLFGASAMAQEYWAVEEADGVVAIHEKSAALVPELGVADEGAAGLSVSATVPGIRMTPRATKGGEFLEVDWPEAQFLGDVGQPALPVIRRLFVAPVGAQVSLTVTPGRERFVDTAAAGLDLDLAPRQAPIPKLPGAREAAPFNFDEVAYSADVSLPAERAVIEELGIIRGQQLYMLELHPVAYNPAKRILTYWPQLHASVSFRGGGAATGISPMVGMEQVVLNPSQVAKGVRQTGNYLIINASAFDAAAASFATAKQAQGFAVSTHSVAPGTTNSAIKSYIQGLWGTANAPDYVLLIGDTDTIPNWTGGGEGSPATDLNYVCMDGATDWYPDIAIGRFPARTAAQLQAIVDKTLYYENGPLSDPDYLKRAVFMASTDNHAVSEGTHNYVINTHMTPNGYVSDKLYTYTFGATTQDVRDSFNDGRFFGIYSGHGGTYSWADGPVFSQADVNGLTNYEMYAFVCSFACITGTYTVDECFTETWIRAANKGAAAIYGSSVNSYWTEDDVLEKRLFDAIFDADDNVPAVVGPIWVETLVRYLAEMGSGSTTRRYFEMYNLMGDPSLRFPGACSDAGTVNLDRTLYGCEAVLTATIVDCGLNTDDAVVDTVVVAIDSDSESGVETMTLTETDAASAEFVGSMTLSTTNAGSVLLVGEGDTVTVTYVDADDGAGGANVVVTATAGVDCTAPAISNVRVTETTPRGAVVAMDGNEPIRGTVHYGLSCGSLTGTAAGSGYATTASVSISGLTDNTTYFYTVEGEDRAGNSAADDNGGACYTFTTPEVPDFFTELFTTNNDLENVSLIFTPNGSNDFYSGCVEPITALPTDPAGGTTLTLTDDDYETVNLTGGATVLLYGQAYNAFYPVSNGYITFVHGETGYNESLEAHLGGIPKISALFDDLNPSSTGTVSWKQLADRVAVTWQNVPEYNTSNQNTFQIVMYFDGRIEINYLAMAATDGLAGLSAGLGVDPDFFMSDLSAMGNCGPRPPIAQNQEVTTPVNVPVTITLVATDDDDPPPPRTVIMYAITSLPTYPLRDAYDNHLIQAHELPYVLHWDQVIYQPAGGFNGTDSFQFLASDGGAPPTGGDSNIATVTITVGGPQLVYDYPLDTNPGWVIEGQWAFGQPTGQGTHAGDPTSGCTGDNVYGYNLNGDYPSNMSTCAYLTMKPIDCTGVTGTELRFMRWLGVESSTWDHATLEASNDGTNWVMIWEHSGSSLDESAWSLQTYDISAVADDQSRVLIRWGMGPTDGSVTYHGWNIDDVQIWGMVSGGCNSTSVCPSADVNCDNVVSGLDIAIIQNSANFGFSAAEAAEPRADVNGDGVVSGLDVAAASSSACFGL